VFLPHFPHFFLSDFGSNTIALLFQCSSTVVCLFTPRSDCVLDAVKPKHFRFRHRLLI
jgi:hypothetical protein